MATANRRACSFETSEFLNRVGIMALQGGRYRQACDVFADAVQAVRDETLGIEMTSSESRCERNKQRLKRAVDLLQTIDTSTTETPGIVVGVMQRVGSAFIAPSSLSCDLYAFALDEQTRPVNHELEVALMFYNYSVSLVCLSSVTGSAKASRLLLKKAVYVQMLSREMLGQCAKNCDDDVELERILRTTVCVLKNQLRLFERFDGPKPQVEQVQRNMSRLLFVISDLELLGVIQNASDHSPKSAPAA
jgi:hypothetical protein